ncbi:MAG: UbiX family flavin prenyltransferase [Magnetococcales bacterium]|nr:UbiX family flavin prenyltransferase [Magnetococcales bacterium]
MNNRLMIGITGASGARLGVRTVEMAGELEVETHLVVSRGGEATLFHETGRDLPSVMAQADFSYPVREIGAQPASGSFKMVGMVIVPCSMKTLSAVVNSYADSLLTRAADVTLKERRPLVLVVRETPLHKGHLDLMRRAADLGAVIFPPVPAFYHRPESIEQMVDQMVARILEPFGLEHPARRSWPGLSP